MTTKNHNSSKAGLFHRVRTKKKSRWKPKEEQRDCGRYPANGATRENCENRPGGRAAAARSRRSGSGAEIASSDARPGLGAGADEHQNATHIAAGNDKPTPGYQAGACRRNGLCAPVLNIDIPSSNRLCPQCPVPTRGSVSAVVPLDSSPRVTDGMMLLLLLLPLPTTLLLVCRPTKVAKEWGPGSAVRKQERREAAVWTGPLSGGEQPAARGKARVPRRATRGRDVGGSSQGIRRRDWSHALLPRPLPFAPIHPPTPSGGCILAGRVGSAMHDIEAVAMSRAVGCRGPRIRQSPCRPLGGTEASSEDEGVEPSRQSFPISRPDAVLVPVDRMPLGGLDTVGDAGGSGPEG